MSPGDTLFLAMNSHSLIVLQSYMFQNGDRHPAVKTIKNFLNYCQNVPTGNLKADDSFDAETRDALKQFQSFKRLIPTGRMDLKTWTAVGAAMDAISITVLTRSDANARALLLLGQESKFPARKTSSFNNAAVYSSPLPPRSLAAASSFPYDVYVTAFAPFDYFGPFSASRGDKASRPFGIDPDASYRLRSVSTVTPSLGGGRSFPFTETRVSTPTTSYLWKPWNVFRPSKIGRLLTEETSVNDILPDDEKSEGYLNDAHGNFQPGGVFSESDSTDYHLYGNDDAFALWGDNSLFTSDIDVHPFFTAQYFPQSDPEQLQMRIWGSVTGDQFPAVEAYVLDHENNGVMLGVWQVRHGDGPVLTREGYRGIIGDKRLPMFDFDVTITVKKGLFTEVVKNGGRTVSLAEHNQQYTSLPTVGGAS